MQCKHWFVHMTGAQRNQRSVKDKDTEAGIADAIIKVDDIDHHIRSGNAIQNDWNSHSDTFRQLQRKLNVLLSYFSFWWGLLASVEPRRLWYHSDRRGILPSYTKLQGRVRALPNYMWRPPHQDTKTASERDPGQGRQDSQRPTAPTAAAAHTELRASTKLINQRRASQQRRARGAHN